MTLVSFTLRDTGSGSPSIHSYCLPVRAAELLVIVDIMPPKDPNEVPELPRETAERLFGAPSHTILVSDRGPSVAFMGWRLGSGRAEAAERGGLSRVVEVEIYVDEDARYAVAERAVYSGADGQRALDAAVTLLGSAVEVRAYCDAASIEPMRDAALCTALDHVAKFWPHLGRRQRRQSSTPPFLKAALRGGQG